VEQAIDAQQVHWLLWAKQPRGEPLSTNYHPLLCHLIDVALVTQTLWDRVLPAATRHWVTTSLQYHGDGAIQPEDREAATRAWLTWWAGIHDVGKASPPFQLKDRHEGKSRTKIRLEAQGFFFPDWTLDPHHDVLHGTISAWVLRTDPPKGIRPAGISQTVAQRVGTLVGGHHGTFPSLSKIEGDALGAGRWPEMRSLLADLVADPAGLTDATPRPTAVPNAVAMFLAGLISVADWIGSNADYYHYAAADEAAALALDRTAYATGSALRAANALDELGWTGWEPSDRQLSFGELFPKLAKYKPRGAQPAAIELAERAVEGPMLAIIEAPMGEGKTEAAWYLADRWMISQGRRGVYVALPTQATSNGMFARITGFLSHRYPHTQVQLQLLHGHAALSAEFQLLIERGKGGGNMPGIFAPADVEAAPAADGSSASVVAGEWFTYRKRGLLAPFGVGTIDQSLLAVLQSKHVFVRLFGLGGKTVILDEVHAYDTYMTALMERLLQWLAALDTSVILLSATLPAARRKQLVAAYAEGLGIEAKAIPTVPYPRLTWLARGEAGAKHTPASPDQAKRVRVERVDGALPRGAGAPFPLGERLMTTLAGGGCVAVICSTVDRAQRMYTALHDLFATLPEHERPQLDLLHARLPFDARQEREGRLLTAFGEGTTARPFRAVLVATQVIEQSLDLDFDLLISDMAPIDLILQRLGRVHRHRRGLRPEAVRDPVLWLCWPSSGADGLPRFDPGTAAIYDAHLLLRSWIALKGLKDGEIALPDQIESLVEDVYGDQAVPADLGPELEARWLETQTELICQEEKDRNQGDKRRLRPVTAAQSDLALLLNDPREEDTPEIHQEHQALTRLGRPSVTLICLYGMAERACLTSDGPTFSLKGEPNLEQTKALLHRSVSITQPDLYRHFTREPGPAGWKKSALLRHCRPLFLDAEGRWIGHHERVTMRLDTDLGLVIERGSVED